MNSDFSNAQWGETAWSIQLGKCMIKAIDKSREYPIAIVAIDDVTAVDAYTEYYTTDGKLNAADTYASLFHEKPECFRTKTIKTVEMKGCYDTENKVFRADDVEYTDYFPAKAVITYEVEE